MDDLTPENNPTVQLEVKGFKDPNAIEIEVDLREKFISEVKEAYTKASVIEKEIDFLTDQIEPLKEKREILLDKIKALKDLTLANLEEEIYCNLGYNKKDYPGFFYNKEENKVMLYTPNHPEVREEAEKNASTKLAQSLKAMFNAKG